MNMTLIILFAVGVFGAAAFMVAAHTAMAGLAAQRSGTLDERGRARASFMVGGFLAVWLGIALASSYSLPRDPEVSRLVGLAIGFTPFLVAVAALFVSRTVRAVYDAMPPQWLIWVQSYRMLGIIFLAFYAAGVLPGTFAVPAALGDFATGYLALFVGPLVARGAPRARLWATAWNLFGILDLIVAPATALASQSNLFAVYPLVLVPLFLGPPLGILTHVYSLRSLAVAARRGAGAQPSALFTAAT
jgi:hypothetical protein